MTSGNAETLRRLQFRVQNHGDAPTPQSSSSPTAPSFSNPPPPMMNGHAQSNGYASSSQFSALHQPAPPRTPVLLQQLHNGTKSDTGSAAPTYFFKDSPFFEVRELILSNITLEGTLASSRSPQWY